MASDDLSNAFPVSRYDFWEPRYYGEGLSPHPHPHPITTIMWSKIQTPIGACVYNTGSDSEYVYSKAR